MKEIEVTIEEDGRASIEVLGPITPDCVKFTEFLEKGLGSTTSREMKNRGTRVEQRNTSKRENKS